MPVEIQRMSLIRSGGERFRQPLADNIRVEMKLDATPPDSGHESQWLIAAEVSVTEANTGELQYLGRSAF